MCAEPKKIIEENIVTEAKGLTRGHLSAQSNRLKLSLPFFILDSDEFEKALKTENRFLQFPQVIRR